MCIASGGDDFTIKIWRLDASQLAANPLVILLLDMRADPNCRTVQGPPSRNRTTVHLPWSFRPCHESQNLPQNWRLVLCIDGCDHPRMERTTTTVRTIPTVRTYQRAGRTGWAHRRCVGSRRRPRRCTTRLLRGRRCNQGMGYYHHPWNSAAELGVQRRRRGCD
jgi:hypothetical protein